MSFFHFLLDSVLTYAAGWSMFYLTKLLIDLLVFKEPEKVKMVLFFSNLTLGSDLTSKIRRIWIGDTPKRPSRSNSSKPSDKEVINQLGKLGAKEFSRERNPRSFSKEEQDKIDQELSGL